jgi:hypothetical protein
MKLKLPPKTRKPVASIVSAVLTLLVTYNVIPPEFNRPEFVVPAVSGLIGLTVWVIKDND